MELSKLTISKKKQSQFDLIFVLREDDNFFININLLKNIFDSDFYEHFIMYIEEKIKNFIKNKTNFSIYANLDDFNIGICMYYSQILQFAKMLHTYSENLTKIFLTGSSSIFSNFVSMLSSSLGYDISKKITFI